MVTTNRSRTRGRPRKFDPEAAVATAQQLFHERGYDAVSVADVTDALGINPPSFYAAFGSKAGLYQRVLDYWTDTEAIPLADILRPDVPVADAVAAMLEEAARRYAFNPAAGGCLVLEGTRCNDDDAREAARALNLGAETFIHDYIAARHPEAADQVTDFVATTMSGLSAKARSGHDLSRLLATARLAGSVLTQVLPA
ncbi:MULTISPECIES: TetR/AcrR family transcriptional regulator [Sphingopyxis]|jgi:TetR/AcrR family transcriptional regulator, repressor for divergent bdcA|uniref:Transcriptional regulator, TetR family n=1 Tax=Sphingopyxis alaskensis (strain DSM 13593 / LMG 18877 / RB2256) TaxID=317655 RepID=Q1GX12_SPHAL|nr:MULTISPECIES: TetR/AcrR family transcriptional regulator [Sphingopyxis]ABF51810.1 transcriptional regulator, TetR family [Sphingopyxis alaskensis RB2256]KTE73235.1 TetR family transcriptional regulator [Sphingopyxis sp. H081]MBN8842134.1 TetR/AcrR family transcriptional regulator [Sphingomonadales bacterium]HEX2811690.1 TetR/AcrR family transcriptional regulator [Sphingopyxis sp.]KTE25811.1 TetR family transcriptional regulator [Sphingopyxis sp. H057]